MQVFGIRNLQIMTKFNNGNVRITVQHVSFAPEISHILISLGNFKKWIQNGNVE